MNRRLLRWALWGAGLTWTLGWLWVAQARWRFEQVFSRVGGPYLPADALHHFQQEMDWKTPLLLAPLAAVGALLIRGVRAWSRLRARSRAGAPPLGDAP